MKRLLPFILPTLVLAQSYPEVIARIDASYAVQSARAIEHSAYEAYLAAEGKHLPSLDARLSALKLNRTPTAVLASSKMQTASRNNVEGEVTLTYPLFSGFALSASAEKARLHHEKALLETSDLKRNLYLDATRLYAAAAGYEAVIAAQKEAKIAIDASYAKARGMYANGLLAPAELYAIEAKGYEIEAQIAESQSARFQALNTLSYLTGERVEKVELPSVREWTSEPAKVEAAAQANREDLLALAKALGIARSDIALAESRWYPQIALVASLKRHGDTFDLNGDGYTNADKSYGGVVASWNLFSGMSDYHALQASKASELAAYAAIEDYKSRIISEIRNTALKIEATHTKLLSARMRIKAAEEYAKLTRGRFDNQLSSADELSRAIADLASAKAAAATLESELFTLDVSLLLQGGLEMFRVKTAIH